MLDRSYRVCPADAPSSYAMTSCMFVCAAPPLQQVHIKAMDSDVQITKIQLKVLN